MPRHPLTLTVLAFAIFLRVWVPAGWMPAAQGSAFAIEPCPAAAPAPAIHSMKHDGGDHHGSSHQNQHSGDCAFAPAHAAAAPSDYAPLLPAPVLAARQLTNEVAPPFFATGPPSPPPPARGPPAII